MVSWAATADMVARRWIGGDVPTAYARNTLTKGEQQVRRSATSLAQAHGGQAAALARYRELAALLAEMKQAVGKGDKGDLARLAGKLPPIEQQLDAMRAQCRARTS